MAKRRGLRGMLRELIGASQRMMFQVRNLWSIFPSRDYTQVDYAFWDKARRGRSRGLELSGLFIKPLCSKVAAWVMGDAPQFRLGDEDAEQDLNDWWAGHHASILRAYEEALALGDCYIVVNADLSVTVLSPDVVQPLVAADDYSRIVGWRITQTFPNPDAIADTMSVVEEYTERERVVTKQRNGVVIEERRYRNLIGRLPVIHVANRVGADEVFGKPEAEALINVLHRYGEVFDAALKGNIRQGRPTPVIEKMGTAEQVSQFWERFGRTETQTLPDGTVESYEVIDFDPDQLLTLGGEAVFSYKAPGSFSADTEKLLGLMFYLILQYSEVPEFAWGNAIASSKASADAQMPPFTRFVNKKRGLAEVWVMEVALVVARYQQAIRPALGESEDVQVRWRPLDDGDQRLKTDAAFAANDRGILPDEVTLLHMPFEVEDPSAAVAQARREREERAAQAEDQIGAAIDRLGQGAAGAQDEDAA